MHKKVVLIIPPTGYHYTEYHATKTILEDHNIKVITACTKKGTAVCYQPNNYVVVEQDSTTAHVDTIIKEIDPFKYDGFFLIGGPGSLEYLDTPEVHTLFQNIRNIEKPYGAICTGVRILAKADVLSGKKATGWNDDGKLTGLLAHYGGKNLDESVVVDDNVITAICEPASEKFAHAIVEVIEKA